MRIIAIVLAVICIQATSGFGFDLKLPRIAERTCTLVLTKIKKDKKERVTNIYGYRRTDAKRSRFEVDVNWKKIDKESRDLLADADRGAELRIVYAWGLTGRYLVKVREFSEKDKKTESEKVAKGEVDESDDADADDDEGEKAAGKPVTNGAEKSRPKDAKPDDDGEEADDDKADN